MEGESNDPQESIHANLEEAMCGGYDFEYRVNGVFDQEETYTIGDEEFDTDPSAGLIPTVRGVPGRDTVRAFGNIKSGLGERREEGGNAEDIEYDEAAKRRVKTGTFSGFDYPVGQTCGLSTLCRPPSHPDERQLPPSGYQNAAPRDRPGFFCDHPCQRPLDNPGKPAGWDELDSTAAQCGNQQPYEPAEDQVSYSCGGFETKGPGDDFCGELNANGQLAGVCQDMNNWVYIQWRKMVHICVEQEPISGAYYPVPIYRHLKGQCGFPEEVENSEDTQNRRDDEWEEVGVFECCSDDPFPGGKKYSFTHKGVSCIPCNGEECRINENTNEVIVNDVWLDPFPSDLPNGCLLEVPADPAFFLALAALVDLSDPGVNIGPWPGPDPNERKQIQEREYISYFREYENASYERAPLDEYAPDDDHKKENIPVACYGMYDMAPENAKLEQTDAEDKRCTIAAYYEESDGDGEETNFWNMKDTQEGKGTIDPEVEDDPFNDPDRAFDEEEDIWFPELSSAFSMLNEKVFEERFDNDFSFVLLAPDSALQRTTVQLDKDRKLSSGALIRTFDDTITIDEDQTKERRTMVEWWHRVETEMHKNFTPPTVRMLLPTTWSIDINPLDPIYTPPPPDEEERSPDPRSETIEVQIQAGENLLGDIAAFMERNLLLRMESEPLPVVVPMANPTELRAWAQGWEAWALKQEEEGLPGSDKARKVSAQLLEYADQADNVRELRGELAKYAAKLLHEQSKMHEKIAQWVTDNIEAYQNYLVLDWGISQLQFRYKTMQNNYQSTEDNDAFPWCRNSRFTAPIYSLLDPWLPGREDEGDVTGGFGPCFDRGGSGCEDLFTKYNECLSNIEQKREENPDAWPTDDVCDPYFPLPPAMPELPNTERDADIIIDFTAFREAQKPVSLPVLKPIQIRLDFDRIRPPGLEDKEEPNYPEFVDLSDPQDLPELPESISDEVIDTLPEVIIPGGEDFDLFSEAAVLTDEEGDDNPQLPTIQVPQIDLLSLSEFLEETDELIEDMTEEYKLFWTSLTLEPCEGGEEGNCVRPGTEQDCIRPHDDPEGKCVHFEADLKERFQRIGSRPAVFLFEDFASAGAFRKPFIMGQTYCEREDWACQLLNKYSRKPRDGWQVFVTEDYDPTEAIQDIREKVREATDNIIEEAENRFLFDMKQEQMYENFKVPEGERIEKYRERFDINSSSSSDPARTPSS